MRKTLLLSAMLCLALALRAQTTKNFIDQPYIEVSGNADTLVAPDEIYIAINVSEKDTRDKISLETLEMQMADALKGLGIDIEKDLVIKDIASNFKTYLLKGKDVIKAKQYVLKVGDAETAGRVFLKLEELGISNASIDHVDISNRKAIRRVLLSKAAESARENADALTAPLHQKVGKAIEINGISPQSVLPVTYANSLSEVVMVGYKRSSKNTEPQPDISFQKENLSAGVNVKFVLE